VIKVKFKLGNTGSMPAEEVAQLYVRRVDGNVSWPVKELKAFRRVTLDAGQTKVVTLEIPVSELRYWNEQTNGWALESGTLELLLGGASDDIRLTTTVKI
jgi:beta-glucosidase